MQYLLMLRHAEGTGPQEGTPEFDDEMRRWNELNAEMKAEGVWVAATGLGPGVTTLRAPGGEPVVTDGPYAEAKEILFSFYVLDVEDLDAALAWARKAPSAEYGSVEVYPTVHAAFA